MLDRLDADARHTMVPLAAAALRTTTGLATGPSAAMDAVSAARELTDGADAAIRMAVDRARAAGRSWTEIGSALGTSRQAAFQRYARTGARLPERQARESGARAAELFIALAAGDFDGVRSDFGREMAASLGVERLAGVWADVTGMVGQFERTGAPIVRRLGDCVVADVPLAFEAGDMVGRVSFDDDGRIAGLFFLNAGATR